jgi:hypothetical protein
LKRLRKIASGRDAFTQAMKSPLAAVLALIVFIHVTALAWGPHWDITRAGLDTLGTNHVLRSQLGTEFLQLTNYCWLPDFRRIPFRVPEQDFYSDDYLLFPNVTKHFDGSTADL